MFHCTEPIWKVGRYTSAAPMYFSECDNYVDGGVLANNPCQDGLSRIQQFYQERGRRLSVACMVSVGSGIYPAEEMGSTRFRVGGVIDSVQTLFRLINSAVSEQLILVIKFTVNFLSCVYSFQIRRWWPITVRVTVKDRTSPFIDSAPNLTRELTLERLTITNYLR